MPRDHADEVRPHRGHNLRCRRELSRTAAPRTSSAVRVRPAGPGDRSRRTVVRGRPLPPCRPGLGCTGNGSCHIAARRGTDHCDGRTRVGRTRRRRRNNRTGDSSTAVVRVGDDDGRAAGRTTDVAECGCSRRSEGRPAGCHCVRHGHGGLFSMARHGSPTDPAGPVATTRITDAFHPPRAKRATESR